MKTTKVSLAAQTLSSSVAPARRGYALRDRRSAFNPDNEGRSRKILEDEITTIRPRLHTGNEKIKEMSRKTTTDEQIVVF